jgi:nicotinamidase-related amidase
MSRNVHLLAIDPQNDFCDLPAAYVGPGAGPSLPVPGAHADMQRLALWIGESGVGLTSITITLDSHQRLDVAHPGFWQTGSGAGVTPFTQITAAAMRAGSFRPRRDADVDRTQDYLDKLEARGRYTLMVWPVHCELGSWGHAVHADLRAAYNQWEERTLRSVEKVLKGQNRYTEHYSAILAEVPLADDPATQRNDALLADLDRADLIVVAGEAGSHCVKATVEDLVAYLPGARPQRVVLLTDCISPVTGFEGAQAQFYEAMREHGVRLATSIEMLDEIRKNA